MEEGLLCRAVAFAAHAHDGQHRKGSPIPYIVHPMEVAAIAATMTEDETILAASVLHDVVEDCPGVTGEEVLERFGERVHFLVMAESEKKEADAQGSWMRRKQTALAHLAGAPKDVLIITLSDKLSNIRALLRDQQKLGDALWERFHQKDKAMHAWYYRSMRDALLPLKEEDAFAEYAELVQRVFGEDESAL